MTRCAAAVQPASPCGSLVPMTTRPLRLGWKASAEQFGPGELLDLALRAEAAGLDSVAISDHFQPFRHTGGHSPASLPWLGAVAARTSRLTLLTSVLTPTFRYHPSVVAHAFATLALLAPGRIVLGVGTGESLNDVPATDAEWPSGGERLRRLQEAVELMRTLWSEDRVSFEGQFFRTRLATIYDRPDEPVPIYIAAGAPRASRWPAPPATASSRRAASRASSTSTASCRRSPRARPRRAAARPTWTS